MKWNRVTTNDFGDVIFWDENEIVFSIYYHCCKNHDELGNVGWITGFSSKEGSTTFSEFCG